MSLLLYLSAACVRCVSALMVVLCLAAVPASTYASGNPTFSNNGQWMFVPEYVHRSRVLRVAHLCDGLIPVSAQRVAERARARDGPRQRHVGGPGPTRPRRPRHLGRARLAHAPPLLGGECFSLPLSSLSSLFLCRVGVQLQHTRIDTYHITRNTTTSYNTTTK